MGFTTQLRFTIKTSTIAVLGVSSTSNEPVARGLASGLSRILGAITYTWAGALADWATQSPRQLDDEYKAVLGVSSTSNEPVARGLAFGLSCILGAITYTWASMLTDWATQSPRHCFCRPGREASRRTLVCGGWHGVRPVGRHTCVASFRQGPAARSEASRQTHVRGKFQTRASGTE